MAVPLVLINAFPLDKEQWEPTLEALAAIKAPVGDIITFDPPGIGDMPATEEDPSLDLIADAAVAAMREVTGRRDALWVGCSMGGYVAMAVLHRHPDAVAGLGLIGTRASEDTEQARQRRESAAAEALSAITRAPRPTAASKRRELAAAMACRLSKRSTITPEATPKTSHGTTASAPSTAIAAGSRVKLAAIRGIATLPMPSARFEAIAAIQRRLKSRDRRGAASTGGAVTST